MSEQRFAEAARVGLSGSEISTLLGGEFKEPGCGLVCSAFALSSCIGQILDLSMTSSGSLQNSAVFGEILAAPFFHARFLRETQKKWPDNSAFRGKPPDAIFRDE